MLVEGLAQLIAQAQFQGISKSRKVVGKHSRSADTDGKQKSANHGQPFASEQKNNKSGRNGQRQVRAAAHGEAEESPHSPAHGRVFRLRSMTRKSNKRRRSGKSIRRRWQLRRLVCAVRGTERIARIPMPGRTTQKASEAQAWRRAPVRSSAAPIRRHIRPERTGKRRVPVGGHGGSEPATEETTSEPALRRDRDSSAFDKALHRAACTAGCKPNSTDPAVSATPALALPEGKYALQKPARE